MTPRSREALRNLGAIAESFRETAYEIRAWVEVLQEEIRLLEALADTPPEPCEECGHVPS